MENELKARITADISGFVGGMKKVEEATDGVVKDIILLEAELKSVEKQYKTGKISIDEYASRINRLNTNITAQRKALSSARSGFQETTKGIQGANTVALEFNRIIQDAPFGIIGVGNNIQQLAGNFSNLSKNAGGTVPALKAAFSQLITGPNLALLGISALTSAFTLYQMGAFDFLKSNEEAAKSLEELADEINNAASKTAVESANITALRTVIENETLSREQRLAAINRLQSKYPEIFANADKEKLLNGELITSYDLLTKAIIQRAEASLAEERIPQLDKEKQVIDGQIKSLQTQLKTEQSLLDTRSKFVGQGQLFSDFDLAVGRIRQTESELKALEFTSKGLQINIDGFTQSIISYNEEFANLLEPVKKELTSFSDTLSEIFKESDFITQGELIGDAISKGIITEADGDKIKALMAASFAASDSQALQDAIATSFQTDFEKALERLDTEKFGPKIKDVAIKLTGAPIDESGEAFASLKANLDEIDSKSRQVQESFSVLGSVISTVFKDNPGLGQFVSSLAKFAGEIIARNFAIAKSNAIAGASAAGAATGPAAPFVTPGLIAAAIALVATAFSGLSKSGGGASGGGGSSQTFGNTGKREFGGPVTKGQAYIVGEKRPELFVPNTNGVIIPQLPRVGGTSTGGGGTMKIQVEVVGRIENESIRLANKRANTKVRNT